MSKLKAKKSKVKDSANAKATADMQKSNKKKEKVAKETLGKNKREKVATHEHSGKSPSSRKATKGKEPQTMEELLEMEGVELRGLRRGDVVEGTVSEIGPKSVYIDIGAKTEGMVVDREYSMAVSYVKTLQPGDKVDAYVLTPENESGQIILSLRQAAANYLWQRIEEWMTAGEVLRVKVREINRGGAIVEVIDELTGFVPSSQMASETGDKLDSLVGKELEVKIIDANREEGKIILSERAVSEAEDIVKKRAVLQVLEEGKEYKGVVTRIVPFGLFVRLKLTKKDWDKVEGVEKEDKGLAPEGLVHISELSWEKVDNPEDIAKVGDEVKVIVLQAEPKVGKLSFSIKRLTDDPWKKIEDKYKIERQVKGVVSDVMPFGVFVMLEPGISGLIHVSKLLGQVYKPGDKVDCYVESIDKEGRRLSLDLVLKAKPVGYK